MKCETFSAIYNIGEDGERHPYPNENIYFSHHGDFDHVKVVSCDILSDLKLGHSVKYDAGKRLVKAPSVPIVYAVGPEGILHPIKDETQAIEIYGNDWAKRVDDISEVFLSQYTLGDTHPDSQLLEGTVLAGADGKLLRADASGFAVEIEDLIDQDERELLHKYALEIEGVEERFERTIHKISVSTRTDEQTLEYELKYKVIHVVDGEKVEIEIEIEEATEAEKEADRLKIEIEVEVEDDHSTDDNTSDDTTNEHKTDADEGSDDTGDDQKTDAGSTDEDADDAADHGSDETKDDTTDSDTTDGERDTDPADEADAADDEADAPDTNADGTPVTEAGTLELQFTHSAGVSVAYPGDQDVLLGQFTFGAPGEAVTVDDVTITLLVQDAIDAGGFSIGGSGAAFIQSYLDDCRLVNSSTGVIYMGPLGNSQIGADQMVFIDNFYMAAGDKLSLDLTCDMTAVEPSGDTDMLAVEIGSAADVNAIDTATGNAAAVTQLSTNGDAPGYYYVELLETPPVVPTISLHASTPSGAAVPGLNEVLRFNVSAPATGNIELLQIPFSVITTDNAATDWNHCGNANGTASFADASRFVIYDDSFSPVDMGWTFNRAGGLNCISQVQYVAEDMTDVIANVLSTVNAGTTATYMVYANTTGASSSMDDAIRFDIDDEASFIWSDGSSFNDGVGVDYLPITGGTQVY